MQIEKIQLKSIKLESLNAECLLAVNRCVRYLKHNYDVTLKLQDRDVLTKLSALVRECNDSELSAMYQDLKDKMVVCVHQSREE